MSVFIIGLVACIDTKKACGNTLIQEAFSPSGRHRAVSFYRSCGVLSDERVAVSILPAGAPFTNEDGNVFMYTDTLTYAGSSDTTPKLARIRFEWTGENELRILYDRRARVFVMKSEGASGKIVYLAADDNPNGR